MGSETENFSPDFHSFVTVLKPASAAAIEEDTLVYDNLAGKVSGNPDFKSWSMTPSGKWNYAFNANKVDNIKVKYNKVNGFPFDLGNSPVTITVPVVGVKDWTLVDNRFTPALPKTVVSEERSDTVIELVPYGSTTLRLTIFPVLK